MRPGALGRSPSDRMVSCPPRPPRALLPPRACHPASARVGALARMQRDSRAARSPSSAARAQGRPFLAFVGVLASASLLASVGLMQQSSTGSALLEPRYPSAAPSLPPVRVCAFARAVRTSASAPGSSSSAAAAASSASSAAASCCCCPCSRVLSRSSPADPVPHPVTHLLLPLLPCCSAQRSCTQRRIRRWLPSSASGTPTQTTCTRTPTTGPRKATTMTPSPKTSCTFLKLHLQMHVTPALHLQHHVCRVRRIFRMLTGLASH